MKKIQLNHKYMIELLIIILICLLIWFIGPYINVRAVSWLSYAMVRLCIIAGLISAWVIVRLILACIDFRINRKLMENCIDKQTALEDNDQQQFKDFKQYIQQVLVGLRKTTIKHNLQYKSLIKLPWFLVIGAPGAGKSTVIQNADLFFPLQKYLGKKKAINIKNKAGCEWWITDKAVFIEVNRYLNADQWDSERSQNAWLLILSMLKKYRKNRAINGLIVVIEAPVLINDVEALNWRIKAARQRIYELSDFFRRSINVYILVNQCDRIAGFRAYFQAVETEVAQQLWGMSFPVEQHAALIKSLITRQFCTLKANLEQYRLTLLDQAMDEDKKTLITFFPEQFQQLKPGLDRFIDEVFADFFDQTSTLRGVYFTSGIQTNDTVNPLFEKVAEQLTLPVPTYTGKHEGQSRAFFLKAVYDKAIFAESELMRYKALALVPARWRYCIFMVLIGFMLLLGTSLVVQARKQHAYTMMHLDQDVAAYNQFLAHVTYYESIDSTLPLIRPLYHAYTDYHQLQHQWLSYFLILPADMANHSVDLALYSVLDRVFMPFVIRDIVGYLSEDRAPLKNVSSNVLLYQALLAYLSLSGDEAIDRYPVQRFMAAHWRAVYPQYPERQAELSTLLNIALQHVVVKSSKADQKKVNRALHQLANIAPADLVYALMKSQFSQTTNTVADIHALNTVLVRDKSLPTNFAFYTKKAYHAFFLKNLKATVKTVLDNYRNLHLINAADLSFYTVDNVAQRVTNRYALDYAIHWDDFLSGYHLITVNNLGRLNSLLMRLSKSGSALVLVLQYAAQNTAINIAPKTIDIPNHFSPIIALFKTNKKHKDAPLKTLQQQFVALYQFMNKIMQSPDPQKASFNIMSSLVGGKQPQNPLFLLHQQAATLPPPLSDWVRRAVGQSVKIAFSEARRDINTMWQLYVLPVYMRALKGRYPFMANSHIDVPLDKFTDMFSTTGLLQQFFDNKIKPFVNTKQAIWHRYRIFDYSIGIPQAKLNLFKRYLEITRAFFPNQSKMPNIVIALEPINLDNASKSVAIQSGDRRLLYRHGSHHYTDFVWPNGNNKTDRLSVTFTTFSGRDKTSVYQGPWAWFRLLQRYQLYRDIRKSHDVLLITADQQQASFLLKSTFPFYQVLQQSLFAVAFPDTF